MNGRHLVMGTLSDALTGETLADTHDNRYRQKLARLLLDSGLPKTAITKDFGLAICPEERPIRIPIDFVVRMEGHVRLIVRYGPGSIVSRRQPGLAAARSLRTAGAGHKRGGRGTSRYPDRRRAGGRA